MTKYSSASRLGAFLVSAASLLPLASCGREYAPPTDAKYTLNSLELKAQGEVTLPKQANLKEDKREKAALNENAINFIPKLNWDIENLEGFEILYENPIDEARFISKEQSLLEQVLDNFYVDGKKLGVQKDSQFTSESERHYSLRYSQTLKDIKIIDSKKIAFRVYGLQPNKDWITIIPSKLLDTTDGRGADAQPTNRNDYFDSGIIRIREGEITRCNLIIKNYHIITLLHELRHLFISLEEPTPEEQEELFKLADKFEKWLSKTNLGKLVLNIE